MKGNILEELINNSNRVNDNKVVKYFEGIISKIIKTSFNNDLNIEDDLRQEAMLRMWMVRKSYISTKGTAYSYFYNVAYRRIITQRLKLKNLVSTNQEYVKTVVF